MAGVTPRPCVAAEIVQVTEPPEGVSEVFVAVYLATAPRAVLAAAAVVAPVPPLAIATVPDTLPALPVMLPEIADPGMVADAVKAPVPLPFR